MAGIFEDIQFQKTDLNTVKELKVSAPNALIKEGLLLNNLTTQKVKELLAL